MSDAEPPLEHCISLGSQGSEGVEEEEDHFEEYTGAYELWERAGGEKALQRAIGELRASGYRAVWTTRGPDIVICLEVPYAQLGLDVERAHSLRLPPDATVVVRLEVPCTEVHATSLLHVQCVASGEPGGRRRLCLPAVKFRVFRADPGSLGEFLARHVDGSAAASSSPAATAAASSAATATVRECAPQHDFGVRWSIEDLLNRLFPSVLAVESEDHPGGAVGHSYSLAYVRRLLNQGLAVDTREYASQENQEHLTAALQAAVEEHWSTPRPPTGRPPDMPPPVDASGEGRSVEVHSESLLPRVDWVAVPKALRPRRVNVPRCSLAQSCWRSPPATACCGPRCSSLSRSGSQPAAVWCATSPCP
jgi:hypothetical protein